MAADSLIADTTARIFAEFADPHAVNAASDDLWRDEFWRALVDAGLPLLWVPEEAGGVGATFAEGLAALEAAGAKACAVPLAEAMAGAWLLARTGLNVPTERLALLPPGLRLDKAGRLWGHAAAAPFAFGAKHLAGIVEGADGAPHVVLVEPPSRMDRCEDLAGDERGSAQFDGEPPVADASLSTEVGRDDLLLLSAAARAALMAGALGALVELSVGYAQERQAFGRTISRFQAVQHLLARLVGEAAAASVATQAAGWSLDRTSGPLAGARLDVATAKVRAGEAAGIGAAIAHQIHGAIGYTAEHVLHRFTRRLWSWRDDYGSETFWAGELGRHVATAGAEGFWGLLTGNPAPTLRADGFAS